MKPLLIALSVVFFTSTASASATTNKAATVEVKASIPSAATSETTKNRVLPLSKNASEAQTSNIDYWIHDAWMTLTIDHDYDGFASAFSLSLDADTNYNESLVYAVVYLGKNDVYDSLYVTSDFYLYGDSSNDVLTLDIDLLTGYPAADYDVMIELYDAYNERLLAVINSYDDSDLAYQPLESRNFDSEYVSQTLVVEHHGGALGSWLLWMFAIAGIVLKYRKQS